MSRIKFRMTVLSGKHVDKRPVTSKRTDLRLEFLMGKVDVEKRNEIRTLFEETRLWFDRSEPRELPF